MFWETKLTQTPQRHDCCPLTSVSKYVDEPSSDVFGDCLAKTILIQKILKSLASVVVTPPPLLLLSMSCN